MRLKRRQVGHIVAACVICDRFVVHACAGVDGNHFRIWHNRFAGVGDPSRQRGIRRLRVQEASQQKRERSEADEPQQRQAAKSVNGPPTGFHREKYPPLDRTRLDEFLRRSLVTGIPALSSLAARPSTSHNGDCKIAHGAVLNVFSESLIYEVAGIGSVHCPDAVRDLLERERKLASVYPKRRSFKCSRS